jgi:FtsP/CotA-like multicopper oxidase with cupredoxin domain
MEVNGESVEAHSWDGTMSIPAFGEIVIRRRVLICSGKLVDHCHIPDHEDRGMMCVVEVVK